jgi:signal transduction histidine kinase
MDASVRTSWHGRARATGDDEALDGVITLSGRLVPRSLELLRWAILGATTAITLVWPFDSRIDEPIWAFMLLLLGYNLVAELLRRRTALFGSFARVALLDLPIATVAYYLDEEPGGPLFVIFFLGVISAGMTLDTAKAALYLAATIGIIALVAPTLPGWTGSESDLRQLSSRLLILLLAGVGTVIARRQLLHERQQTATMRAQALQLQELDRLRTEFVEMVSHDLRTPLTSARAGLGILAQQLEGRLEPVERGLLNNVRRNVDRLGIQIDNLLMLNQLDSGTLRPDLNLLDLRGPANAAVATVRLLLREKAQKLRVSLPEPLPVLGDADMLEQLIVNLLANAHRHTPSGTLIQLDGQLNGGAVTLVVRDNGPGVAPEEQASIFQRYYRHGQVGGGSGLGLAIVAAFAQLHHGQVTLESVPGAGATFILTVPVAVQTGLDE